MNISPQDMNGGVFRMFTDDIYGNRTEAPGLSTSYSSNNTLAPGDSITGGFTVTNCYDPYFTLAYFGPIGVGVNGQPLDTIDSNACASIQFANPSPCSVSMRWIYVSVDDGANGAGADAWIKAYTFSNQPWGTEVHAEFHDGNNTEPYYVSDPSDIDFSEFVVAELAGAIPGIMNNGYYFYGGNPYFDGYMFRSQFYLPAPMGYYIIASGENPALNPLACADYGCTYPQQPAGEYPMIVDPGLPDWTPTVDGYYTSEYQFSLVGTGPLSAQFLFPQFPNLSAAAVYFCMNLGPSFNPNSVCSGPTNSP